MVMVRLVAVVLEYCVDVGNGPGCMLVIAACGCVLRMCVVGDVELGRSRGVAGALPTTGSAPDIRRMNGAQVPEVDDIFTVRDIPMDGMALGELSIRSWLGIGLCWRWWGRGGCL